MINERKALTGTDGNGKRARAQKEDAMTQFDADATTYNRKFRIHAAAMEILRNGSSTMTKLEAVTLAEARDAQPRYPVRRADGRVVFCTVPAKEGGDA